MNKTKKKGTNIVEQKMARYKEISVNWRHTSRLYCTSTYPMKKSNV